MRPSHVVIAFGFNDGIKSSVPDRESIKKRSGTAGAVREALMLTRTYRLARRLVAGIGRGSGSSTAMAPRVDAASYRSNIESIASMARACGATPVIVSVRNKYPDQAADAALALGTALVDADSIAASVLDELVGGGGDPEWRRLATARFGETVLKERPRWWVDADVAHYAEIVHARLAEEIASIIMGKR